jgi:hypothetical protein
MSRSARTDTRELRTRIGYQIAGKLLLGSA